MAEAVIAAIAAAGAEVGGAAGAALIMGSEVIGSTLVAAAVVGANAAMGSYSKRQAARSQRNAYNASLKDREVMIRSAIAPRRMVLGRDRISGPIVYVESTGSKGQYLHLVIALAHGECDAIEEVWFNDVKLPDPDGSGFITSGEFAHDVVKAKLYGATIAGSALTLPYAASKVLAVTTTTGGTIDDLGRLTSVLVEGWAHTPGSADVTGLAAGTYEVNYERTTYEPRVRIKKHLGGAGQVADADLVAESAGNWTADHVGHEVAYLYARLEYDQDVWGQIGVPNISVVMRGAKCFDPRTGLTVWTDNAALLAAKWLRDGTFGLGASSAQVPSAELIAEGNICDEVVALNAGATLTQKRYTYNGSATADESPRDVLGDILSGMAGHAVWVQGRWLLRAGAYRTPAPALNEDALAGAGVSIVPRASRSELFNAVRVTHRDRSQGWAEVQAPLVANSGYQTQDGGRQIVRSITLPGEMDTWRAQRLGKIELERARQSLSVQISTNLIGYDLAPTDTVPLTLARYGWAGKVFEVRQRTYDPLGALQYLLVETAAGVWAWNYGEATVGDLAPNTVLPNPYSMPATPTGVVADAGSAYTLRSSVGQITPRAFVSWNAMTDTFVVNGGHIEVQWKTALATEWQDSPRLEGNQLSTILAPMPGGDVILVRVRAVNASGRASYWAVAPATVASTVAVIAYGDVQGRAGMFRATSRGLSDATAPFLAESWSNGALVNAETNTSLRANSNMYTVGKIHRSTQAYSFLGYFNPFSGALGGLGECNAMAAALNGIDANHIAVVTTWDEPQTNRMLGNLPAAMYRCGASRAVFGSPQFKFRCAYTLIGIGGCGEGNGYEAYSGSVDSDATAWCDVAFYLQNGNLVISGTTATPRTLADYSYTGDLNATYGATFGSNISGTASTTDIASDAVASVYLDPYDFAGTTYTSSATARSFTITPPVDCTIEMDATLDAKNFGSGDGAYQYAAWTVQPSAGTETTLISWLVASYSGVNNNGGWSGTYAFAATGGVALTFRLKALMNTAGPITFYQSIVRVRQKKR